MNAAMKALLFAAGWLVASAAAAGGHAAPAEPAPVISARVEPASATVGDVVSVTLNVDGDPTARILPPIWGERWGEAEIVSQEEGVGAENGALILRLRAFRTGAIQLPARALSLRKGEVDFSASSPAALALTIRSVLPPAESDPPQPKPAQPPVALPAGRRFWWSLALAAITILVLGLWLALRRRPSRLAVASPRLAPLATLRRALAAIDPARIQEATTATSAALRVYLRDALGIPAPESTTSEIRQAFHLHSLEMRLAHGVLDLLRELDGVKFASRPATTNDTARWIAAAGSLAGEVEIAAVQGNPEQKVAA